MLFKLGLIINPLAGIGGAVALKGSDGEATLMAAQKLGAVPQAENRTRSALAQIEPYKDEIKIYTAANAMGEDLCQQMGFDVEVVQQGQLLPVIGVPAGCKIHSAVYAVTPKHAGELLALIIRGRPLALQEAAVMDIDEDAFRQDRVKAKHYGQLQVPAENQYMQNMKDGGVAHEELVLQDIAAYIIETMEDDVLYFVGSGSTPKAIMDELGLTATLLGVDLLENQQLLAVDVNEKQILSFLKKEKTAKIILTIIGGQGHLFGRGNQQFSAEVIRKIGKQNIIIIATPEKLQALNGRPIRVDTGDEQLNHELYGMTQVVTGYDQHTLYKIG